MSTSTDPIRSKEDLQALSNYFLTKGQLRNHALIVVGVCTALRVSDLLSLKWSDVYDFQRSHFRGEIRLIEQKTGKRKIIALNSQAIAALSKLFAVRAGEYIFSNGRADERPLSRSQAWRIIRDAARDLGIPGVISCHSLRKTLGYRLRVDNDVSPVILMHLYNHTNFDTTRRYLGLAQDEINNAYLSANLFD